MWEYNYDYLCHGLRGFKYIKREKGKNGKWVYTYPGDKKIGSYNQPSLNPGIINKPVNKNENAPSKLPTSRSEFIRNTDVVKKTENDSTKKITADQKSKVLKELFKTYKKSKDTNLPERERIQNEQAIGQILNTVETKYGIEARQEIEQIYSSSKEKTLSLNEQGVDRYIKTVEELKKADKDPYDSILSPSEVLPALSEHSRVSEENMKKEVKRKFFEDPSEASKFSDDEILYMYWYNYIAYGEDLPNSSVSQFVQSRGYINEKDMLSNSGITKLSDLKRIKTNDAPTVAKMIDDDVDMELVNHSNLDSQAHPNETYKNYPADAGMGYTTNCAYCSLAYELRQRGYDVEASARNFDAKNTQGVIESWYEDIVTHETAQTNVLHTTDRNKILNALTGDTKNVMGTETGNARGNLIVSWTNGSGHSMVYEVIGGEVTIRDCQTNESWSFDDWYDAHEAYLFDTGFIRTDNKKIRDSALVGVKNRSDD